MVKVVSFGCRINSYEAEIFKEKLKSYDNLIVVNTCAVTKEAERQCCQTIRKLKKENPNAKIVVTGCAAQVSTNRFSQMEEVDLVLGNMEKTDIEKYLISKDKTIVGDIFSFSGYDAYMITGFEGRERAFVEIQQGCDHRCTYCIIPYARGANRSVKKEKIIEQIKLLLEQGFKEICLTGIDACSYKPSFSGLVQDILTSFPELPSLQFGSLDPAAIDDDFIELVKKYPNICPHFHFSIQSGDNLILKRMGRRHQREDVISLTKKLRLARIEATFGADFICGFPTETEDNFNNTLKLVEEADITKLHVFPYSERPGTPASKMPQVPVNIRRKRAEILRNLRKETE
ncbi:MAG: tRNA (N(6)-L-threonylcarbamoyladenosine(37)-C(2))-methylthiotransferase MtaB [Alphaproteobacteria bacterium]|nr:tRNA (N(6)-L-threonylcarbamoyladenosine(37)-C(2))-methylthiotransferase MtaB [Alphaproteobacteria bacterium]